MEEFVFRDIAKAIAAGANAVMVGGLPAGTEEAPGEIEPFQGRSYKSYRAWVRLVQCKKVLRIGTFKKGRAILENSVPEGIEGRVPFKGPMPQIIHQLTGGLRASMGYTGCATIAEMRSQCRFVQITHSGYTESHVHDVTVVKEAPNYQRGS